MRALSHRAHSHQLRFRTALAPSALRTLCSLWSPQAAQALLCGAVSRSRS